MSKRCWRDWVWPPARADTPGRQRSSAFDQPNISSARSLAGILGCKFHALSFPEQFEDGASYSAAMEEMLDTASSRIKPNPLSMSRRAIVGWHTEALRSDLEDIPARSAGNERPKN